MQAQGRTDDALTLPAVDACPITLRPLALVTVSGGESGMFDDRLLALGPARWRLTRRPADAP